MDQPERFLSPPPVKSVRYPRNFIKTAVCELRFPTLLELEAKPPNEFQRTIRKTYPLYESRVIDQVDMTGADEVAREHHYLFRSKDKNWTIALKSYALAIETSKYVDFEGFFSRVTNVLKSAQPMIDADFFTRVGLRYINWISVTDGNLEGWLRPEFVLPVTSGVLGAPDKYMTVLQGRMEEGSYSIRHGLKEEGQNKKPGELTYMLDFDYFIENVELDSVEGIVRKFHETNFSLFTWCLGDKAKAALGEGKAKI